MDRSTQSDPGEGTSAYRKYNNRVIFTQEEKAILFRIVSSQPEYPRIPAADCELWRKIHKEFCDTPNTYSWTWQQLRNCWMNRARSSCSSCSPASPVESTSQGESKENSSSIVHEKVPSSTGPNLVLPFKKRSLDRQQQVKEDEKSLKKRKVNPKNVDGVAEGDVLAQFDYQTQAFIGARNNEMVRITRKLATVKEQLETVTQMQASITTKLETLQKQHEEWMKRLAPKAAEKDVPTPQDK